MTDRICQSRTCNNPIPKRDSESWPAWAKRKYCSQQHARDEARIQAEENPMPKYPHKSMAFYLDTPNMPQAACKGRTYVADSDTPSGIAAAKEVCVDCPELDLCRDWAITTRQSAGVWGGLSLDEREKLRRRMSRAA